MPVLDRTLCRARRRPGDALDTEGHHLFHGFAVHGFAFQREGGALVCHRVTLHCNSKLRKVVTVTLTLGAENCDEITANSIKS